jgi:hypothetical protein
MRIAENVFDKNRDNHFMYGMYAFGLVECNKIQQAEELARQVFNSCH